ncbi:MAG TPA: extracellular solute-binding protein [Ktedonobacteraceae bacterium]|nr:extracellular solute-binding protein [Ktedonobacteraceae bacterium]
MARSSLNERLNYLTRRQAIKTMGLGATALALSGCNVIVGSAPTGLSSLGKDPAPGRKIVIEIYSVFGSTVAVGWNELAKRYEQVQPDVGVKITFAPAAGGGGDDNPKLFTSIAGNTPPDISDLTPFSTPQWAELGIMTDLTPYLQRDGITADMFFPISWHDMNYKGRIWQVQWDADPNFAFFWNKDLFEKVGLDPERPPQTIDEVDEYSQKINRSKGGNVTQIGMIPWSVYGFSNSIFTWGWAFGGEFYDPVKEEVTPDNEYVVKALEWMVKYAKSVGGADKVNVSPPNIQTNPFGAGTVGMAPMVVPDAKAIKAAEPNMHMGVTLLPYQRPGASQLGAGGWLGGWGMFIPRGAKHPDEAWEFIKWASTTPQGTLAQWQTVNFPPACKNTPVFNLMKKDPIMSPYYNVLIATQHSRPAIPVGAFYATQFEQIISDAVYGKLTPLQALRTVKANTMKEWDRFKREVGS